MSAPLTLANDVVAWFRDGDHWHGASGVPTLLGQHTLLTLVSTLMAMVLGLPVAVWFGHRGRGGTFAVNLSNIGRAIPIVALLSLLSLGVFGTGEFGPFGRSGVATLITLALFALPPIVTNAYTALIEVDRDVVEAARGMGMGELRVLREVELPLAMPLIVSGIRLAVVQVWATATIAALVAGPGLGRIIVHGYESFQTAEVVAGSLIVAVVALALEVTLSFVQKLMEPFPAGSR